MESEFLKKYGDKDNFDADRMEEDLKTLMFQIALKEQKLSGVIEQNKENKFREQVLDISVEYLTNRKELAEKYIEKIKKTEE